MRLGEILIRSGLIVAAQLETALRAQGGLGGRIGTNLIEMGFVEADEIANALAAQKGVPAARLRHFEQADRSTLRLLPRHLAERHNAIPLGVTMRFGKELVVAFMDPDNIAAVDEVGFATGHRVRPSVGPEFYILHFLERHYEIPPRRLLRRAPTASIDMSPAVAEAVDLAPVVPRPGRRSNFDADWTPPPPTTVQPMRATPRAETAPAAEPEASPPLAVSAPPMLSAPDAIAVMSNATTRDQIGAAVVGYSLMAFGTGLLLICKNEVALGWLGFARGCDPDVIESLTIPLVGASAFRTAVQDRRVYAGPPPADGAGVHQRLWKLLRSGTPSQILVAPIVIRDRVVNLLYAHTTDEGPNGAALPPRDPDALDAVCNAASMAFVELIKNRSRG